MRRKSGNCPKPRTSLTLVLEPEELAVLDEVGAGLELDRKSVLMRGLYLLDAAGLLMLAPASAVVKAASASSTGSPYALLPV